MYCTAMHGVPSLIDLEKIVLYTTHYNRAHTGGYDQGLDASGFGLT